MFGPETQGAWITFVCWCAGMVNGYYAGKDAEKKQAQKMFFAMHGEEQEELESIYCGSNVGFGTLKEEEDEDPGTGEDIESARVQVSEI